jgi:hypothetical protein
LTCPRFVATCVVLAAAVLIGCSKQPAAAVTSTAQSPATQAPAPAGAGNVTGTVLETMDAKDYTYIRVKTDSGELWAASSRFPVAVGDRVVVPLDMPMEGFHSASLNRDFALIYFAPRILREGEPAPAALPPGHPAMGGSPDSAASATVTEPMAPPDGGMTIAGVWAKRVALAGNAVTVRGKVVKFNGGILGTNWVHLQDGTGNAKDGSNDLTITTDAVVKVGDIITATGKIALDKDLGAGYSYPVLLEGATVR